MGSSLIFAQFRNLISVGITYPDLRGYLELQDTRQVAIGPYAASQPDPFPEYHIAVDVELSTACRIAF